MKQLNSLLVRWRWGVVLVLPALALLAGQGYGLLGVSTDYRAYFSDYNPQLTGMAMYNNAFLEQPSAASTTLIFAHIGDRNIRGIMTGMLTAACLISLPPIEAVTPEMRAVMQGLRQRPTGAFIQRIYDQYRNQASLMAPVRSSGGA
ncbi:MAG: hypothetical protein WED00_10815 [Aquisalimonadaceae bacterium]